jgi:hypothetical protein
VIVNIAAEVSHQMTQVVGIDVCSDVRAGPWFGAEADRLDRCPSETDSSGESDLFPVNADGQSANRLRRLRAP